MSKKTLYTLFLSLAISFGLIYLLNQDSEQVQFNLKKESIKVYELYYNSNISFNESITKKNSIVSLNADLHLRVFDVKKEYSIVGFELSNVEIHFDNEILERKLEKLYSELIFIKIAHDGKFIEFILPRSSDDLKGLLELFSHFQVVLKEDDFYQTTENSFRGEYISDYKLAKNTLYKSRITYLSTYNETHRYIFKNSKSEAIVAKDGIWLDNITVTESVVVEKEDMQMAQSKTTLNLSKIDKARDHTLKIYTENRDIDEVIKEYREKKENNKNLSFWEEEKKSSQIHFIRENNITYETLLGKVSKFSKIQDYHELSKYLSLYPNYSKEILKVVQNETSSLSAGLISALQDADTKESKEVLITILKDENISSLNRQRASIALGGLENPDDASIEALQEIMGNRESQDDLSLSNSAILSLGRVSNNLDELKYEEVKSQLANLILNGDDDSIKRISIIAAGNSNTEDYFQEIKESFYSDSNSVKFAAIEVLANMKTDESKELLLQGYDDSNDENEKMKIVNSLSSQKLDENTVYKMQNELLENLGSELNDEVIKYLCKSSEEFPSSKPYLEKELPLQNDSSMIKLIIKAIR
ncbi:MAG: HEAT repeat domain-containing protein [Campylobacterota bacterium]|nr:HEAT repeat domain-containing protein [Campylobacterota bacterium]